MPTKAYKVKELLDKPL